MQNKDQLRLRLRLLTWFMILGILISGATALPLETELGFICEKLGSDSILRENNLSCFNVTIVFCSGLSCFSDTMIVY
jgi:hypothetical protein